MCFRKQSAEVVESGKERERTFLSFFLFRRPARRMTEWRSLPPSSGRMVGGPTSFLGTTPSSIGLQLWSQADEALRELQKKWKGKYGSEFATAQKFRHFKDDENKQAKEEGKNAYRPRNTQIVVARRNQRKVASGSRVSNMACNSILIAV